MSILPWKRGVVDLDEDPPLSRPPVSRRKLLWGVGGAVAAGTLGAAALGDPKLITSIAGLFDNPQSSAVNMRFRQGTIVAFDPNTLLNTVQVGNTQVTNLPLLGLGEATTYQVGDTVGLMVIGDDVGAQTYAIIGKMVTPNTPAATKAVGLLNQQIFSAEVVALPTGENMPTGSFGDCATVGPQVTVNVGPSGRVLAIATVQIQGAGSGSWVMKGLFGVQLDGANSHTVTVNDPFLGAGELSAGATGAIILDSSVQNVYTGLTPGMTNFTMKYLQDAASTVSVNTFRRTLTVIKL